MSGVAGAAPGRLDRRLGRAGAVLLGLLVLVAALAPVLAPYDPTAFVGAPYTPPGPDHPLGTNDVGQDLLSELIYGARVSLLFGLVAAIVGTGVGLLVGTAAGFLRGRTDAVLMRIVDIVLVIPFLPLLLILAAFFGGGVVTELIVISAVIWARPSREIRSQALSVRERGHVQAALAMGASGSWILARHVLPAVISLVPPQLVRAAKGAILLEASLSFLGLGDPTVRSWGTMLYYANARGAFLGDSWLWWVVPPGVALGVVVLGFAFVGYALESWGRPALSTGSAGMADRAEDEPATGEPPESRAPASDDAILAVRDLSVSYGAGDGRVRAVRSVDLDVARGEVVGIVGESGSGKTSLIRAILGLVPPPGRIEGGEIAFLGRDLRVLGRDELRDLRGDRLALIPQAAQNALDPLIAVADQVAEAIVAHRDTDWPEARRRAADLLAAVGIPADRHAAFPHQFSGGMRQRVLIAMALANDPALLLADEPTTGLDSLTRVQLLDLFAEIRERSGLSILLVSHDLPVVLGAADRVAVMVEGSIVEEGTPRELTERPRHPYTKRLLAAAHLRDDAGWGDDAGPDGAGPDDDAGPGDDGHAAPALRLENVSRRFTSRRGDVLAVDGVDLEVGRGEIVGLVGRSGAGKSTLARLIVGLERPDGGLIELPGGGLIDADATGPARLPRHTLRLRQIVFQDPYSSMPPHLRVDSIVAEPLRIYGERGGEDLAAREALDTVGLRPVERFLDRYPHELSGGELQRVALARAVIARPELIVADEPASLLDAPLRAGVVAQLASIRARLGTSILYITHDIGLAVSLCDRLVVLAEGRVVDAGSIGELHAGTRHPETERLVEAWRSLTLPRSTDRAGD